MPYSDKAERIPGVLVSPDYGLLLRFMLNPEEIEIAKENSFSSRDIPGYRSPQEWWTSGQFKTINFSLFFDSSSATDTGGLNLHTPTNPLGLRSVESIIQEFQYPKNPARLERASDLPQAVKDIISDPDEFLPPPPAFLVYGLRVWKCRVISAPIREMKHDPRLNPTQIEVNMTLHAIEEGRLYDIQSKVRRGMALAASGESAATLIPDLFSDLL